MDIYLLQGTNAVEPMMGTNAVEPMMGTNAVTPMMGTNAVEPMMGTNAVMPVNGYDDYDDDIIEMQGWLDEKMMMPMRGYNGTYYVSPLALMEPDDVPMDGVPMDATDEDIAAYQLAYMYGDPDALQGPFKKFFEKRAEKVGARRAEKNEKKAQREEKQALKMRRRRARTEKAERGEGFFDKFGGALKNVSEAVKTKIEQQAALDQAGIEPDDEILSQRAAMDSEDSGGLGGWWNNLPTAGKIGVVAGGALVAYGVYKFMTKKKGRK